MEKLFKILFVGSSVMGNHKALAWALIFAVIISLIEWGDNDGVLRSASVIVLIVAIIFILLSCALTWHYDRQFARDQEEYFKRVGEQRK